MNDNTRIKLNSIINKMTAGDVAIWLLTLLIIGYTAYRSIHLVSSTLPEGARQIAYFALFALDFALVIWKYVALYSATSPTQNLIAIVMTYLQIVAVCAVVVADTILVFYGSASTTVALVATWLIPLILGANLVAATSYKIFSPHRAALRQATTAVEQLQLATLFPSLNPDKPTSNTPFVVFSTSETPSPSEPPPPKRRRQPSTFHNSP